MSSEKRGDYSHITSWIRKQGYSPDTRMQTFVDLYWGWMTANNGWYHYSERRGFRVYKRERVSLCPAWLASAEWSSLLMQEQTSISSGNAGRARFIADHFANFAMDEADNVARAFGLGTMGWACEPRNVTDSYVTPDAEIGVRAYDATQIIPLTYSDSDCTQCAFVARVEIGGRDYDQCQMHVVVGGERHIVTQLFDAKTRKPASAEGILPDFNTHAKKQTFALFKVAVPNDHYGCCAMGASVFDKATGAIKAVDEAHTSFIDHLRVGRPKMFVDKHLVETKTERGEDGSVTKTLYAFGEAGDTVFTMQKGEDGKQIDVVQPDLRVDANTEAINTALRELSLLCGFGNGYFSWDAHTGLKTAKEVSADNSMLARSIKKHQNAMRKAITTLVDGYIDLCVHVRGDKVPDGDVTVTFDDGIITDTTTDKEQMIAEIGAGIASEWEYRVRFYGESPEEAQKNVPQRMPEYSDLIS